MGAEELRTEDPVNPVEKKVDNPNSITDKDEIWRIEAVWKDVENSEKNEKMKWFIEKESKDELNKIKDQCLNIIKAFDWSEEKKEEAAQAILSLLRINQILWKVKIAWWSPIDLNSNCFNQLVALVWTKWIDFKTILWNEEWEIVNAACKKAEWLFNKPSEEDQKKIDTWNQSKDDISYLKGISDWLTGQWVNSAFLELRKNLNAKWNEAEREKFEWAVFALIKKCCPQIDWEWSLDNKFYSDKIKEFQQAVLDKSKEEGVAEEYKKAWSELSNDIKPVERAIDGKLWRNTLNSLVAFATKWLKFEPKPAEKTDWSAKFEWWKEKKETWDLLDRMPTVFAAFKKYGELTEKKWYQLFSFNNEPWKSDFVMKESWTGNEYVKIGWKKFYINLESWQWGDKLQFKNKPVLREVYGDVQKTTDLCFGKFDQNWNLIEWSKITIDSEWRQISSLIMTDTEVKGTDWKPMWKLWLKTMWWRENKIKNEKWEEVVTQDVKWRIDIFWEDWKDTKRLSDEQLDALMKDKEAVKVVLDLAINAFKDTMHKPSTIWRYNLNSIISRILTSLPEEAQKELVAVTHNNGYLESWMTRKERVASFLRLEHWLFSDPENKINKNDLDARQWHDYNLLKTNAEKREFRSKLKQWDRIVSRLGLLKQVLEGKVVVNPKEIAVKPEEATLKPDKAVVNPEELEADADAEIDIDKLNSDLSSALEGIIDQKDKGILEITGKTAEMNWKEIVLSDWKNDVVIDSFLKANETICGVTWTHGKMKLAYLAFSIYKNWLDLDSITINNDWSLTLKDPNSDSNETITYSNKFWLKGDYIKEFKKLYNDAEKTDVVTM